MGYWEWPQFTKDHPVKYSPPLDKDSLKLGLFSFPASWPEKKYQASFEHTHFLVFDILRTDVACGHCKIPYTTSPLHIIPLHPLMVQDRSFHT